MPTENMSSKSRARGSPADVENAIWGLTKLVKGCTARTAANYWPPSN